MKDYQIKIRPISELKNFERNSRIHSEGDIAGVASSIREFGFTNPVLIHNDTILAGHCRVEAAKRLGWSEVPTIALDGLTEEQARAYVIADNKLALNSTWDNEILKQEITELKALDFDVSLLGFTDIELSELDNAFIPDLPDDEPKENNDAKGFVLRIVCEDEEQQQELFIELRDRGLKVKV